MKTDPKVTFSLRRKTAADVVGARANFPRAPNGPAEPRVGRFTPDLKEANITSKAVGRCIARKIDLALRSLEVPEEARVFSHDAFAEHLGRLDLASEPCERRRPLSVHGG
jgi:hypothetical protein